MHNRANTPIRRKRATHNAIEKIRTNRIRPKACLIHPFIEQLIRHGKLLVPQPIKHSHKKKKKLNKINKNTKFDSTQQLHTSLRT